ncbi:hypothetical protein [Micromonospora sp. NBC_01796]|uniref:hypothetical protein n=1 Tax=Micromonospora sp. NBC_01796 TaxID=2975987 RepID=UPI002DD816F4|nr:hypothetical protein [Micromonospora sp. NBC_01796]WSA87915.1 hypothetical protein OIE47_10085 [Micromonospora sp. NBC_01796]
MRNQVDPDVPLVGKQRVRIDPAPLEPASQVGGDRGGTVETAPGLNFAAYGINGGERPRPTARDQQIRDLAEQCGIALSKVEQGTGMVPGGERVALYPEPTPA